MHFEKTRPLPDASNNVALLAAAAVIGTFLWWWWHFSGPFRWLIDLEIRLFGGYIELVTAFVLGIPVAIVALYAAAWSRRVLPRMSGQMADLIVFLAMAAVSGYVLAVAWQDWKAAERLPNLRDPVQVVDLDRIAVGALPTGHVRLLGELARNRLVQTHVIGRHGLGGGWIAWTPMAGRAIRPDNEPVRIIARRGDRNQETAAQGVPDNPEGMLIADGIDTRTVYELRQKGLAVAEHPLVLFWPGDDFSDDARISAVMMAVLVGCLWAFTAFGWLSGKRSHRTAAACMPAEAPALEPTVPAGPIDDNVEKPVGTPLERFGFGAAMTLMLAASGSYYFGPLLPGSYFLVAYAAAALLTCLAVALLLVTALSGEPDSAPSNAVELDSGTALLCVMRDRPMAGTSYFRVTLDNARVATLKANQYMIVAVTPGRHDLAVNGRISLARDVVTHFDVMAGERIVYRLHVPFIGRPSLELIKNLAAAQAALANLHPVSILKSI